VIFFSFLFLFNSLTIDGHASQHSDINRQIDASVLIKALEDAEKDLKE